MRTHLIKRLAFAVTLVAAAAGAQAAGLAYAGATDPYASGARSVQAPRDPYAEGARTLQEPRDSYTDGARQLERSTAARISNRDGYVA
ncbi:hypothetical protein ACTMU2_26360 [Cupriavidus basilensis]